MKIRTIRICIYKGWSFIICSVSLLLLSIITNTAKASVLPSIPIQANTSDTIPNKSLDYCKVQSSRTTCFHNYE